MYPKKANSFKDCFHITVLIPLIMLLAYLVIACYSLFTVVAGNAH